MDFTNCTFIHGILIFLCVGCVQNKRKLKKNADDISESNSDLHLNSLQLLKRYGYPSERHSVVTDDGYIVNLFRIPRRGPPVLLVHGIGDSSDCWLVLGPTNSLAFLLSDAGFDVWLYNARGNKYSKGHTRNLSSKQYWNFSYEEMGSQDLPATIDYILRATSQTKLSYVGFSQGTTIFLVMCSMRPEYNDKIKHAILLAPVAWLSHLKFPFIDILTQNLEQLTALAENIGLYELFSENPALNLYHAQVCNISSPAKVLCDLEYYFSYGLKNISNLPVDRLPVIASHIPAGSSAKTFVHFMQGYVSKRFQRYHYYGGGKNTDTFGSPEPPEYNVSQVSAPVTLMCSEVDWFSGYEDVQTLRKFLPNIVNYVMFNKNMDFTHLEFVFGARVKALINDPVIRLLRYLE
ncbi:lipase 3-like [Pectinophora gossypiella]|uniref:lipase 3-like n=1 Tax=Pectinophora gossypiella TaxID=13191 RepID=UPI00214E05B5|nr:lipase 3-like [Pectinophora gossypiella]